MDARKNFPSSWQVTTVEPNPSQPLGDVRLAVEMALAVPIKSPPLRKLIGRRTSACLAFTDATRACPDAILIPPLLRELAAAGVPTERITLLCATGTHRPSTFEERAVKLGVELAMHHNVRDHRAHDPSALVNLGSVGRPEFDLPTDVPVHVNRLAAEADLLIATGVVEPHQYAGYSGGGKTVAVGCGGEATISVTHGPAFLDDSRVRLGRIEANPFQVAMRQIARRAGLRFVINVVLDADQRVLAVVAGDPDAVHDQLVEFARTIYEVLVPQSCDVIVAGLGGGPKEANLYQASRAATYVGLAAHPIVREGGVIITPARCPEGAGQGLGEQRFFKTLAQAKDLPTLLEELRSRGAQAGEQRAYMLAQVLLNHTVIIVGCEYPDVVRGCKMIPAATMEEAVSIARERVGSAATALVLPHALHTLPVIGEQEVALQT